MILRGELSSAAEEVVIGGLGSGCRATARSGVEDICRRLSMAPKASAGCEAGDQGPPSTFVCLVSIFQSASTAPTHRPVRYHKIELQGGSRISNNFV